MENLFYGENFEPQTPISTSALDASIHKRENHTSKNDRFLVEGVHEEWQDWVSTRSSHTVNNIN